MPSKYSFVAEKSKKPFRALLRTRQTLPLFLQFDISYRLTLVPSFDSQEEEARFREEYREFVYGPLVERTETREEKGEIVENVDGRDTWRRRENHPSPDNSTEDALVSLVSRFLYSVFGFGTEISRRTTRVFFDETNLHSNSLCLLFRGHASNSCISLLPRFHQRGFLEFLQTRPRFPRS